ncbi:MAG: MoaD family protein [Candidatus Bathyarchaeia archaeon]
MSKVKLRFLSTLATVVGRKELETEASTLKEALDALTAEYGDKFKTKVFDTTGNPKRQIKIYVNGKDIRFLNKLDTLLNDGDEVLILPAVTGG